MATPRKRQLPVIEWSLVAVSCLVVLAGLAPELVLTDSFPLGTDLTGHVVVAWIDSTDSLAWLPGSWSQAMFNGFPVNQLYPWLPSLLAGLLSHVIPLAVAVKLVVVTPLVALPWAAWRAGSWAGLPAWTAVLLAVGTVPYIYDTSCSSCGGNISSTINGEYSFAWSMLFAVLALGAVDRLARERRGLATAVLLVAATSFSHPLPPLWLIVGVFVIAVGREVWSDRRGLLLFGAAALSAALLSAMWWIPFLGRRDWVPAVDLVRGEQTLTWLFPAGVAWEVAITLLALAGAAWAVRRRSYLLIAFGAGSLVALATFLRFTDGGPFYSIRVLPFWQFGRWMLAAVGFAWVLAAVVSRVRTDRGVATNPVIAPAAWLLLSALAIGSTWGWWGVISPATTEQNGRAGVLGLETTITSQSAAVRSTLGGFGARADFPELESVQALIRDVGETRGCGALMWDNGDPAVDGGVPFGDPEVFWQSAIWTDGCIPAADGVLVDSSMTAPAMQFTKSLVSQTTEQLLPNRPVFNFTLAQGGIDRLRSMGIRYYLTHGGRPATEAKATSGLALVAEAGPWAMWEVDKGVAAASLTALPAVFAPTLSDAEWEAVSNAYFRAKTFDQVPLVQSGPPSWPRASLSALPQVTPVEPAGVRDIVLGADRVSFTVQRTGTPVIVRVSAYPGWQVTGADGPYRATANYLVVVPTEKTVTLVKARTALDWLAIASGAVGLALLVGLVVLSRRTSRTPVEDASATGSEASSDSARLPETPPRGVPGSAGSRPTDSGHKGSHA